MKTSCLWLITTLVLLSSCAPFRDRRTLNDMEALMPERPDSALAVLRGLQPRDLPGLHVRPLHALLLSEALDKNYIDLTDDSLALAANHFYGEHGSKLHRLKSWYYLGRIRFNAGNYAEAVICYDKALEYAEDLENNHYMGLINREIANAYSKVWDDYHAEIYIRESVRTFDLAEESTYVAYSQLALARMLWKHGDFSECESVLDEMLERFKDSYIIASIYEMKGLNLLSKEYPKIEEVVSCFEKAYSEGLLAMNSTRLSTLAYVQQLAGNSKSADTYLDMAESLMSSKEDTVAVIYNKLRQSRLRLEYETSLKYMDEYLLLQDPAVSMGLEQSVSFYQGLYYKNESRLTDMEKKMNILLSSVVVLLLAIFTSFLLHRNRKQRKRIIEEMAKTSEVQEEIAKLKDKQEGLDFAIAALFENRIRILQGLSDQYDLLEDRRQNKMKEEGRELFKDEIITMFRDKMKELRYDENVAMSMEEILNEWKDGIMRKFKIVFGEDSPSGIRMSKEDIEMAPYFFSGMKQKTICYFTNHTEHSIKERKRRIKQRIESLGSSYSDEKRLFLDNL